MHPSFRKNFAGSAIAAIVLSTLVACGANDQNEVTGTGHRYNGSTPRCGAAQVATNESGLRVGVMVQVTGDSAANMNSCQTTPIKMPITIPDQSASDSLDSSRTANETKLDKKATHATASPDGSAKKSYEAAMESCKMTDVSIPDNFKPVANVSALIAQKKSGLYKLDNVALHAAIQNSQTSVEGKIEASLTGFIEPAAAPTTADDSNTKCGGWPATNGILKAEGVLPNSIIASTFISNGNRHDHFTVSGGSVTHWTTVGHPGVSGTPTRKLRALLSPTGPDLDVKFYQDPADGRLIIAVTQANQVSGVYHFQSTILGTYTLHAN